MTDWHPRMQRVGEAMIAGNWNPRDIARYVLEVHGEELDRKAIGNWKAAIGRLGPREAEQFRQFCRAIAGDRARY